jgi:hypothetical protein
LGGHRLFVPGVAVLEQGRVEVLPPCLGHGRTCCGSASRRRLAILVAASAGDATPALGHGDVGAGRSGGHRCGLGGAR